MRLSTNASKPMLEETKTKISATLKASWTDEKRILAADRARNRIVSDATKAKMSRIAKERHFGGHTSKRKVHFTKQNGDVVYLQSSYEVKFATILEMLGIDWVRPDPLGWIDAYGVSHRYYPDFKVGSVYIDTKNDYLAKVDAPKILAVSEQNHVDLRIVTLDNITPEYIASLVQK